MPDPCPAADAQVACLPISSSPRTDEADPVGLQALLRSAASATQARHQLHVGAVEHWLARMNRSSAADRRAGAREPARTASASSSAGGRRLRGRRAAIHRRRVITGGRPAMIAPAMTGTTCTATARRRPPRARARDHARRGRPPGGLGAGARDLSAHRQSGGRRLHRPARGRQVDADRRADQGPARGREDGRRALDRPSSPFTQGALLGDRIRLSEHFLDQGVFIRSMANRGALGGLSEAALQAALLLDAAGREDVFVETVGVGQAEIDIIDHADTIVLVLMPGSGDSIQALKAGVMEIPDVIVINKADHPLTDTMVREIRGVLSLRTSTAHRGGSPQLAGADRKDRGRPRASASRSWWSAWTSTASTSSPRASWRSGAGEPAQRGAGDRHRPDAQAPGGGAERGRRVQAPLGGSGRAPARPGERSDPPARARDGLLTIGVQRASGRRSLHRALVRQRADHAVTDG